MIGTLTVTKFGTGETVFTKDFSYLTISSSRIFLEIADSYLSNLPLEKEKIYQVKLSGIEGQSDIIVLALFNDYTFVAGSSDYTDSDGTKHTNVVVLNGRLQFTIVSEYTSDSEN